MQSVWLSIIVVTLPPTLYSIAVDEFYPFGYENGDAKMELRGDVVSSPIAFPSTFNYFTAGHNRCYVSIIFKFFNAFEDVNIPSILLIQMFYFLIWLFIIISVQYILIIILKKKFCRF